MSTILRITARVPTGFRRAGIAHPASPVDHPIERFSDEQVKALLEETNLVVEVLDVQDNPIQPGATGAEGLSGDATGAASVAPVVASDSTTDAQTQQAGEQIAPAGGPGTHTSESGDQPAADKSAAAGSGKPDSKKQASAKPSAKATKKTGK